MSNGKKVALWIVGIIVFLTVVAVGFGVKVYFDVSQSAQRTYEAVDRNSTSALRKKPVDMKNQKPFSVLLLGIDTGDLGRTDFGRSGTMMGVAVNPNQKRTTVVSIARDTCVPIIGYRINDKINHAYAFGGAAMSMDTVQSYWDIPIDHYVAINMAGLKQLVDAVGGITIGNNLAFTQDGFTFNHGPITLNGESALAYSRMRHENPRGDYGRQEHQRNIIIGALKKMLSTDGITKYQEVLQTMETNLKTDMSLNGMKKIALNYRESFNKFVTDQLRGEGFMQNNISYQGVSEEELKRVQKELDKQLEF